MNMDMGALLKFKQSWDTFCSNHPKFPMFVNAVKQKGIEEGTVIDINITAPDGQTMGTNIKVTASDLELFRTLSQR